MKEIAKAQGFKVKFVNTLWGVIFESVKNGDRDIIMSGITITPQRKESVDFSYPYFAAHQLILTQKNLKVNSLAELKGKNIAVCANSAGDIISRLSARLPPTSSALTTRPSPLKNSTRAALTLPWATSVSLPTMRSRTPTKTST